ncbi:MAG: dTDP-glucose 4,6-dehydratase [Rickettsiales bacterium]|nr:dTDP-glucose 4,6-dehydratase [Rickettsiales bacterium]
MKNILITGGAGFIGSCFAIKMIEKGHKAIVIDKLTYAGNLENLSEISNHKNFKFIKGDIGDKDLVTKLLSENEIDFLVNFAAESHVDNSISSPEVFIETNIRGTFNLLSCSLKYWQNLADKKKDEFRFLHVSTDEVFGSLDLNDPRFTEENPYKPNSPYSASKAASDHLVRAWFETYKLPCVTTNCSNNYGPRQNGEKLIPTIIRNALNDKAIPIYGNGKNIRDWIFVEDHSDGVYLALTKGRLGESYCFGGNCEKENIDLVQIICKILDVIKPKKDGKSYKEQITFVTDRLGHDKRYAIDDNKARKELGFVTAKSFEERIKETINWYLLTSLRS